MAHGIKKSDSMIPLVTTAAEKATNLIGLVAVVYGQRERIRRGLANQASTTLLREKIFVLLNRDSKSLLQMSSLGRSLRCLRMTFPPAFVGSSHHPCLARLAVGVPS